MLNLAFRNIARKLPRTILLALVVVILVDTTLVIGGIIDARRQAVSRIVQDSLAGWCSITTYSRIFAGYGSLAAVSPVALPKALMDGAGLPDGSLRVRIGAIRYSDSDGYSFLQVIGADLGREISGLPGMRVLNGRLPERGSREVVVPEYYRRKLDLKIGGEIVIFVRRVDGYTLPYSFVISGIYTSQLETELSYQMPIVFASLTTIQHVVGFTGRQATDIIFTRGDRRRIGGLAAESGVTFMTPERAVQGTSGFISFLGLIRTVLAAMLLCVLVVSLLNIALMQVVERRREIGTLLAIGFAPSYVATLFLLEYLLLSVLAFALSLVVYIAVLSPLVTLLSDGSVLIGLAWRAAAGIFAAVLVTVTVGVLYPCLKAAGQNAAEVLRVTE